MQTSLLLLPLLLALFLITNSTPAQSRSKGISHNHPSVGSQGIPARDQRQLEQQFMTWVRWIGTLNHSLFASATNIVSPSFLLTIDKNPAAGDFTTIQDAIDSLPAINSVRVIIRVNPGTYVEKVSIPATKAFITLEGSGPDVTVVQWGDTAQTLGPNGRPLGTFNSATFAVNSPYFLARNITFQNTTPVPPPGAVGMQAVALRVSGDTAAFVGCRILGAQDTLYDQMGRHYYKDCFIEGSVDFIFGNALSLFEGCQLHAIAQSYGALTAQNRMSLSEDTGFSFVNCRVTGSGVVLLGRAWGNFSRVVFAYTYLDNIIIPQGWYNWGDPAREMTVFYGEYKCLGPGASYAGRVAWSKELTDEEAKPFIKLSFVDGMEWISV
ncbi:putative pectinesterase 53 [Nymphaea thermarum]|nr:putative pectinesterase 53 [Nymphaea thermarum]